MVAKTEEKQTERDKGEEVTKLSEKLKEEVRTAEIHEGIHWVRTLEENLPH